MATTITVPTDWKTTLWGIAGAIIIAVGQYMAIGTITWQGALAAIMVGIKGYISADATKTP